MRIVLKFAEPDSHFAIIFHTVRNRGVSGTHHIDPILIPPTEKYRSNLLGERNFLVGNHIPRLWRDDIRVKLTRLRVRGYD